MPVVKKGTKWAIRITVGTEVEDQLSLTNMCAIHHTGGSRTGTFKEKSHYHIWLQFEVEQTYKYVQELFRQKQTLGTVRKSLTNGNSLWSFKPWDTDFKDWWDYVWKDDEKEPRVVVWTLPFDQPEIPLGIPIVASPADVPNVIIVKDKKKDPAHIRFLQFLQNEGVVAPVNMGTVVAHYVDWTGGNYALRYAKPILQYAWFNINGRTEAHKEYLVQKLLEDLPDF